MCATKLEPYTFTKNPLLVSENNLAKNKAAEETNCGQCCIPCAAIC